MKTFDRFIVIFVLIAAAVTVSVNIIITRVPDTEKMHLVEAGRIVREIEADGTVPDISAYRTIRGVYVYDGDSSFFETSADYVIREVNGKLYRIEYEEKTDIGSTLLWVNVLLGTLTAVCLGTLIFIRQSILKPFARINTLPLELAKGNLTAPIRENKSRYFGKFIWGLDMLREKTEDTKRSELALMKEKKTMLMSLSHDIKTPLSAIKLYSAALSKGIYTDPEKLKETVANISAKADEIEKLVEEIMRSGREDIMKFDVRDGEFYLSEVIGYIQRCYKERLTGTAFSVEEYSDCILGGDIDRLIEVLQNIIENAVKYGDGKYIKLSFGDEEDCRLITVTNSGCTLPGDELPYIFDSFRRGSNVGSKSGSGLGLYICRSLMNAMKGDVFAEIKDGDMNVTVVCRKK